MLNTQGYYNEENTIHGNYGAVFLDDSQVNEATGLQAKFKINKSEVPMCGTMFKKYKVTSVEGSGTLTMNKVSSRMMLLIGDAILSGKEPVFSITSKLKDPGAIGTECVEILGVKFDELTLADWKAGSLGTESVPFTFEGFKPIDTIDPSGM
ncbi:phage tail tube protein [Clostridium tyrobutyricum]|uniref:phage tail tube protein n=1 Tax=Clostridium tyrobutyricum TaxID=1519 RepID=UPI001C37EF3B|nr:phage tail tube protein [Clostridium tyrobutyricum]MBV4423241.1 phage tail tube protein [Clostridium tyrobutyricum]MEA5008230.1 phage tail tube protein [Clostridium tyrobutyricum]